MIEHNFDILRDDVGHDDDLHETGTDQDLTPGPMGPCHVWCVCVSSPHTDCTGDHMWCVMDVLQTYILMWTMFPYL